MNKFYWVTITVKLQSSSVVDLRNYSGSWLGRTPDEALENAYEGFDGLKKDLMDGGSIVNKYAFLIDEYTCPSNSDNSAIQSNGWISLDLRKMNEDEFADLVGHLRDRTYSEPFIQKIAKSRTEAISEWNESNTEESS